MRTQLSRRDFVRGALIAAGALSVPQLLAACPKVLAPMTARSLDLLQRGLVAAGAKPGLSIFSGGEDYVGGIPNYMPIFMVQASQTIIGADATVWIAPGGGGDSAPQGPFPAPWVSYAKPEPKPSPQGFNHIDLTFAHAGIWQLLVEAKTSAGTYIGTSALLIRTVGETLVPGQRALASQTPTFDNPRGVHPICTRTPPCPFHRITLAKALTLGKPTAFFVGTPRYCMSRNCGPSLEELISVAAQIGDRASFVHSEVYRSDNPQDIQRQVEAPTFKQWHMQSEPWLFLIDRTGVISKRFEGADAASIFGPALQTLL